MSVVVKDIRFSYGSQPVLKGVSLIAKEGELLSILGCNGAGKSTLLRCMLGLLGNYKGEIEVCGENIRRLSPADMARQIAYIPQSHYQAFNYSVYNMVLMGTSAQVSALASPGRLQRERTEQALERMGITHLAKKGFSRISGGERQLTLIARALAQDARILILDEPTANLDYGNQLRVMEQAKSLTKEGFTLIQSTHNPEQAFMFSDHILALKGGEVLADGIPSKIITAELMHEIYDADIEIESMYDDKIRFLIPKYLTDERKSLK